jgi:anion-transporting  ArsA/GET3 family ATPase
MTSLWENHRVVVCVGTGGVGKTTLSAALGVAASSAGLKTLVMTIDPARRLAHALGLPDEGEAVRCIDAEAFAPYGVVLKAPLYVQMPEVKTTFDRLVARFAPDEARKNAVLNNRIYHYFSSALPGAHEYAAVERLYEVVSSGEYDFVVLDTPPSQNAVDFLDAPTKTVDFLDHQMIQWWVKPSMKASRWSMKLLDMGGQVVAKTLGAFAGAETLKEIVDFVLGFEGMYEGFKSRSLAVRDLLSAKTTAFVLATSAQANHAQACAQVLQTLQQRGLLVKELWINRVRHVPEHIRAYDAQRWIRETVLDTHAAQSCVTAWSNALADADHDQQVLKIFRDAFPQVPMLPVYEMLSDAHGVESLAFLHKFFLAQHVR